MQQRYTQVGTRVVAKFRYTHAMHGYYSCTQVLYTYTAVLIFILVLVSTTQVRTKFSIRILCCRPAFCALINYWNLSTCAKKNFAHLINYWNLRWVRRKLYKKFGTDGTSQQYRYIIQFCYISAQVRKKQGAQKYLINY